MQNYICVRGVTTPGLEDEKAGPFLLAHEFSHLCLGLYDAYRSGKDASGKDIPSTRAGPHDSPTLNYCLMDNYLSLGGGRNNPTLRQFCIESNHTKNDNEPEKFHPCSCWETINKHKPKRGTAPIGLPSPIPQIFPNPYLNITVVDSAAYNVSIGGSTDIKIVNYIIDGATGSISVPIASPPVPFDPNTSLPFAPNPSEIGDIQYGWLPYGQIGGIIGFDFHLEPEVKQAAFSLSYLNLAVLANYNAFLIDPDGNSYSLNGPLPAGITAQKTRNFQVFLVRFPHPGHWQLEAVATHAYPANSLNSVVATLNVLNENINFSGAYIPAYRNSTGFPLLYSEANYNRQNLTSISVSAELYRPDGTTIPLSLEPGGPSKGYGNIDAYGAVLRDPAILNQDGLYQVTYRMNSAGGKQVGGENFAMEDFVSEAVPTFTRVDTFSFRHAPRRLAGSFNYGFSVNGMPASRADEVLVEFSNTPQNEEGPGESIKPLLSADGTRWTFAMDNIPAGVYTVSFKTAHSLRKSIVIDLSSNVTLPPLTLIPGDINNNHKIDVDDLSLLLNAYNTALGSPLYTPEADLDTSGTINVDDLTLLLNNFNRNGDE